MIGVRVEILRLVDNAFTGFVECQLIDSHGHRWNFIEKLPVVTTSYVSEDGTYPQTGIINCEIISIANGVAYIDTTRPWDIESVTGETKFEVPVEALVESKSEF